MTMTQTPAIDTARLFDHTVFVERLNALLDLLDTQAPEAEIDAQLQALQRHLQQQFAAEEQAMQAANFPAIAEHKKHHDHVLGKLAQRVAQWQQAHDRKSLLDYLENELAEWFVSHVNIRDYVTARHLTLPPQAE
jgi:hemerythrin-like metal-binding protein